MNSRFIESDNYLIAEHFPLLLENRQKILSHPQLKRTWSSSIYLSFAYISGGGLVPIGYLFKAWERGLMTGQCPNCDKGEATKSLHLFCMGGSVLSGANSGWGVCPRCFEPAKYTYVRGSEDVLFAQWATETIALKRELEIPDDFARQWLGAEAVAEVRGGMTVDGKHEFIDCWDPTDINQSLASIPPSLGKLVEILQS